MSKDNALLTVRPLIEPAMYLKRHLLTKGRIRNISSCSLWDSKHQSVDVIQNKLQ